MSREGALTCDQAYFFLSGKALRIKRKKGSPGRRLVPPQRAWLLHCFDQKTGVDFAHAFWIGITGMVFEGTSAFQMKKRKKIICEFEMEFKKSYC